MPRPRVPNRSCDEQPEPGVHRDVALESELAAEDDRGRAQADEEGAKAPAPLGSKAERDDREEQEHRGEMEEPSDVQQNAEAERREHARVGRPARGACDLRQQGEPNAGKRRDA